MRLPEHDPALPVVCFDLDGTLAADTWPSPRVGDPDEHALNALVHYHDQGCEVVVFTARPESHFPRIWRWLEDNLVAWAVYDVTNRKPVASLYFDDRAVRWPLTGDVSTTSLEETA